MKLHYDPSYIQDNGEIRVHQELSNELMYSDEDWHIIHSLRISGMYHPGQKAGECDFVLVSKYGILILEVKGAEIELKENSFFQLKASNREKRRIKPFDQVEHNAAGIISYLKEKDIGNFFVARVVVFPECSFNYNGISFKKLWHLGKEISLFDYLKSEMQEQKEEFREKELEKAYYSLDRDPQNEYLKRRIDQVKAMYPNLAVAEMDLLIKSLIPHVKGEGTRARYLISKENAQSYSEINQAFLMGLHRNPRLMVQGPPGCGKSTYAIELVRHQAELEGAKGLFLCWNEFLACSIRQQLDQESISNIDVLPYYGYIQVLLNDAGFPADTLTFENISEIPDYLKSAIDSLTSMNRLPEYDFIVVDEAQDLFHRGLDLVLDHCQKAPNGIEKGVYYVFYDNTQAFTNSIDFSQYNFVQDYLHDQSTSFVMPIRFRTFGDTGIANFVDDIQQGIFNKEKTYGDSVEILNVRKNRFSEVLKRSKERLTRETNCTPDDMVMLFSSNLIGGQAEKKRPLDDSIIEMDGFELLNNHNIFTLPDDAVGYTSMLKYKGLEKEVVILVISDVYKRELNMLYELYIGASRAISRLVILDCTDS